MSRYTKKIETSGREIAWGFDPRGGGYFIQVYNLKEEMKHDDDEVAYELGSNPMMVLQPKHKGRTIGYSNSEILTEMLKWDLPQEHLDAIALDIPY